MAMKTTETLGIKWEKDRFDSAESVLQIIDASPDSLNHPQGPTVWATMNVRAFAPHVEEVQKMAVVMKCAPQLLDAMQLLHRAFIALLPGAARLAVDIGLLNDAAIAADRAIRAATEYDVNDWQ